MRILVLLLLVSSPAWAQVIDPVTGQKTVLEKSENASPYQWGGGLNYSIRTDLADQVKPRAYLHSLAVAYGVEYVPGNISVGVGIDGAYESIGERRSEILVDDDRKELFINDFSLAAEKRFDGPWKSRFELSLTNEFPTSPEAQREDYASVTAAGGSWSVPVMPGRLTLSGKSEVYYIWNNYEFSPATHMLNKRGGGRLEASARLVLWKGLFAGGMVGTQYAQYLDDTGDTAYRNSIGLGYAFGPASVYLSTSNGTYLDREDAGLWFVDEYRRTVALSVKYAF